jgi:hypothetical protein
VAAHGAQAHRAGGADVIENEGFVIIQWDWWS